MSTSSTRYGDPKTRARILDAALALAAEMGPSMRLADVGRAAGISHQGLYLHFGGRDGLLGALVPHMVEAFDLKARHQTVVDAPDGNSAIERMVGFLSELNQHLDSIGWVLEEAQHLDEGFGRDWRRRVAGLRDAIETEVIGRLESEQALRPEWSRSEATDLFLAVTTLGAWRELTGELGWTATEYTRNVTRMIEKCLLR